MVSTIIGGFFGGALIFAIGIGINKFHDFAVVRKRIDGHYDGRYGRGCLLGKIMKGMGVFVFIMSIISVFIVPEA